MCEILVKATGHYMDNLNGQEIRSLSLEDKIKYDERYQLGDIERVERDGYMWGKKETLPDFILIKVKNLNYEDGIKYQQQIINKYRFAIPKSLVKTIIDVHGGLIEIDFNDFKKNIIDKMV